MRERESEREMLSVRVLSSPGGSAGPAATAATTAAGLSWLAASSRGWDAAAGGSGGGSGRARRRPRCRRQRSLGARGEGYMAAAARANLPPILSHSQALSSFSHSTVSLSVVFFPLQTTQSSFLDLP